jgi:titin
VLDTLLGNMPDRVKWIREGGRVITQVDGTTTYIKNGIKVVYNSKGFPDFAPFLYKGTDGLSQVPIALTGTRPGDFAAANRAAGFARTPRGYTWHHHEDTGLMQLVRTDVHSQFWHSGGFSLGR